MLAEDARQTLRDVPVDVIALFQEAERLVVLYTEPVSQCSLHVYFTAIAFVPEGSAIYETFKHQSLGNITVRPPLHDYFDILRRGINLHSPIYSVVFSPNGDLIAIGGAKQGVQLWNAITGGNIASLGDCSLTSLLVRFSPSGAYLAAAFESGTVAIWDPKVGREHLRHEACHSEPITCLEFSTNNVFLASGSLDRAIQVWSVETARGLYRLATHEGPVTSLVFSSDSQRLFSGSEDHTIIIWDVLTGRMVGRMSGHHKAVNCIAVSKDGSMLVSGSEDKTVMIWDTNSGKCTRTFSKGHHTGIQSVHFFDDDKLLVSACDETVISWNVTSRNKLETIWAVDHMLKTTMQGIPVWQAKVLGYGMPKTFFRHMSRHTYGQASPEHVAIAYAPQSPSFLFAHRGYVYSGSLFTPLSNLALRDTATVTCVSISPDGLWGSTADPQGSLEILDLTARRDSKAKLGLLDNISRIVPSPTGGRFVVNALMGWYLINDDCHILKKIDMGAIGTMRGDGYNRFKFSADGSIFFCAVSSVFSSDKSTVRIFGADSGEQRAQFTGLKQVHSFVASADGAWIACGHGVGQVDVFRAAGGTRASMGVTIEDMVVTALVFSDDAQSVVGGSKAGDVHIWDRASGECKARFCGFTSMITALAYTITPYGARIAIGRENGSLSLWSPSTSASHDIVHRNQATVKNVDFLRISDDRSKLVSSGEDGTILTWTIPDADDAEMARCTLCTQEDANGGSSTATRPHLLSQSDPEDTVDGLFHTTYRVRKDGWLVKGDRRVIWLPASIRPHGKGTFYAFENGLVAVQSPSSLWLFLKYAESRDW